MSTNSTESVTQPPGAGRGRWLLLAAGLVLLGCFVLPWLRFVIIADQRVALSLTGLQAATIGLVETTDGGLLYRSSFWLILAPLAGVCRAGAGGAEPVPGPFRPMAGPPRPLHQRSLGRSRVGRIRRLAGSSPKGKSSRRGPVGTVCRLHRAAAAPRSAPSSCCARPASRNPPSAPRSTRSTL